MHEQENTARKGYVSHPFTERKMVICLHKKGIGSKKIGTMLGIDDSLVRSWIRKYRADGMDALRPYTLKDRPSGAHVHYRRHENESLFQPALEAFATSLDPSPLSQGAIRSIISHLDITWNDTTRISSPSAMRSGGCWLVLRGRSSK